jgi:cardiolipin synthase
MISPRHIPNIITIFRLLLIPPVVYLMVKDDFVAAFTLFFVAGVSDGIDGYLARHYGWRSRLGSILDPLADKLLIVSIFVTLGWLGLVPVWLVAAILARDVIIISGATAYHFLIGQTPMSPSLVSKLNTLVQIALAVFILLAQTPFAVAPALIEALIYIVLGTTILSGIDYVAVWSRKAVRASGKLKTHHD